ncbi:MAG TPA: MFS transporter [Gaiellaceae bacterium]
MLLAARWRANVPEGVDERRLLAANFADALGTGIFMPISVIYLTQIIGLSPVRVGIGLTIAGAVAIAGVPASGALADRFDARKVVLACYLASALAFAAYTAVNSFGSFLAVALVVQVAGRTVGPAKAVLVLGVTSAEERVVGLAWQQTLRNFGYGIGGLLAAAVLLERSRTLFECVLAANAVSYVVASALVLRLPPVRTVHRDEATGFRDVFRDRPFIGLALLNSLIALHDSALQVAMPLWIATRTSAPLALTGLLFTLNTILVVALQVRSVRKVTTIGGIGRSYRTAARAFAVACVAFAFAGRVSPFLAIVFLLVGLAALTRGELENTAGESFLAVELAAARLRGRYLSVFKSSVALQQAIGPALVTTLITGLGGAGWLAIGALLVAGTLASRKLGAYAIGRSAASSTDLEPTTAIGTQPTPNTPPTSTPFFVELLRRSRT